MDNSKLRWLRPAIVLSAAAIVSIVDIVNGYYKQFPLRSLLILLGVILLFMIIGTIATRIIDKAANAPQKKEPEPEDIQLEDEEEESEEPLT
ncbi:MAG: hypothetical protein IJ079_04630 [Lachnospiraceae bacterium]|nr:hypothetical protein [Lachnospiraceae bacterium]